MNPKKLRGACRLTWPLIKGTLDLSFPATTKKKTEPCVDASFLFLDRVAEGGGCKGVARPGVVDVKLDGLHHGAVERVDKSGHICHHRGSYARGFRVTLGVQDLPSKRPHLLVVKAHLPHLAHGAHFRPYQLTL